MNLASPVWNCRRCSKKNSCPSLSYRCSLAFLRGIYMIVWLGVQAWCTCKYSLVIAQRKNHRFLEGQYFFLFSNNEALWPLIWVVPLLYGGHRNKSPGHQSQLLISYSQSISSVSMVTVFHCICALPWKNLWGTAVALSSLTIAAISGHPSQLIMRRIPSLQNLPAMPSYQAPETKGSRCIYIQYWLSEFWVIFISVVQVW